MTTSDEARRLLAQGADPHQRDRQGRTALHTACSDGTVRLLVAGGASPHAVDRDGRTPLHTVRDARAARALLAAGAYPRATDHGQQTPLHTAVGAELIELLLAAGIPVDVPDGHGRTPLWNRTYSPVSYHYLPEGEGVRAVRALLAAGADPARRDADGVAPIHNLRRCPSVLGDDADAAALRALMREAAEAALGPGLRHRVSPEHAIGLAQRAAAVHPRGAEAVTATRDGMLVRWSLGPHAPRPVEVVGTDSVPFTALARSPDGTLLALGRGERQPVELRRWDRLDEVVAVLDDVEGSDCLSFSADGSLLAVGWWSPGGGTGLAVVDVAERRVLGVDGMCDGVEAVAFAPDGTLTVAWLDARTSDAEPGMIALYDTARRHPVWTLTVDDRVKGALQRWGSPVKPRSVCFVADDRQVAVGLRGGMLVLDARTGAIVQSSMWWPTDIRTIHAVPGDAAVVVSARDGFHRLPLPG